MNEQMPNQLLIVAGPNGAGKTTFARKYMELSGYHYLSADELATHLTPRTVAEVKIQAGRNFFQQLAVLRTTGANIIMESTLAGLGLQRIIADFKTTGYVITIVFIYLETPEACLERVKNRVLKGGHNVPASEVKRRFYRSKKNFWQIYKNQVHHWHLFCNQRDFFQEVAIGEESLFIVTDQTLFEQFLPDLTNL
jgi:predicted ABC-type ATPase